MRELDQDKLGSTISWIKEAKLNPREQLAIYRGSIQGGLTDILRSTFPVCHRLVGADYFTQLASIYIAKTRHWQPDITYYGVHFAAVVQTLLAVHQLDYLAEVAALEWAYHLAQNGAAIAQLDLTVLMEMSQEAQAQLSFGLDKASTLFYSTYPILRIWQVNQMNYQGEQQVDLNEGATRLLIHRRGPKLCMSSLTAETFKMLTYFSRGETFETVCQKCFEEYPEMDIPRAFAECIQQQYLVSIIQS